MWLLRFDDRRVRADGRQARAGYRERLSRWRRSTGHEQFLRCSDAENDGSLRFPHLKKLCGQGFEPSLGAGMLCPLLQGNWLSL